MRDCADWGNLFGLLGFTSAGNRDRTIPIPIPIFGVLFGLSMDCEVYFLSRIREEWKRTGDNREAMAHGPEWTSGAIMRRALLTTRGLGLGMTVAVPVDATIVRTLLAPATMRLLGRWNRWLPGRPVPVERRV